MDEIEYEAFLLGVFPEYDDDSDYQPKPQKQTPIELTEAQLASKAKKVNIIKTARKAVKALTNVGDTFIWPSESANQMGQNWTGATATISSFSDEWCYVSLELKSKKKTQNFGYPRVLKVINSLVQ